MPNRILLRVLLLLACLFVCIEADIGPASDVMAIHGLVEQYLQAVDKVDLTLLSQIWSHSPEASFIYPLGEEHGYDAIEQHVFRDVMDGLFKMRHLETRAMTVHVAGNAGWSEFHWTFHATLRKDGSAVTTKGVETQIYRKEAGKWRLVHVHYSEEPQPTP
jgi:ketosteroid isomerase-like protein